MHVSEDEELERLIQRKLARMLAKPAEAPSRPIVHRVDRRALKRLVDQNRILVLHLFTSNCPACHTYAPAFHQVAAKYGDRVAFAELNLDEDPALASYMGVQAVPTTLFFVDGREVHRIVGAVAASHLSGILDQILARYAR